MDHQHNQPNRLIHESSPYLLQHAYNPVDWYPWGEEALRKAKQENKPILVSIGYSSCHWCHVMERESFEDASTAAIMNEHFINIKIDREERPDIDHIYMDAVQAMTGSGGWPLNVFLTPDLKPFYGGTYFPSVKAFNRASWKEVLLAVASAFRERRHEIDAQADNLTEHLQHSNSFSITDKVKIPEEEKFCRQQLDHAFQNLMKAADKEYGGFGRAPKFPGTFSIQFLLSHYYLTKEEAALKHACLSLDKMVYGGIYDQLGGGFARYSTDNEWLVPHFEKMLYDNALLIIVLSEVYQLTRKEHYREVIMQTMDFIQREFTSPENGFYSALDADSDGEEGKYYVWTRAEINEVLGKDADIFCEYYDVSDRGNWEGHNILRVLLPMEEFAAKRSINITSLTELLSTGRRQLLERRSLRVRPDLDDKILLGWNSLMNKACSKAYAATGIEEYRVRAERNMDFILKTFCTDEGRLLHTYKEGKASINAFLDDYVYLVDALIHLQEIKGDNTLLKRAMQLTDTCIKEFFDPTSGFFFFSAAGQKDVLVRKIEIYDGAVPSGNSVMALNLHYLSVVFDRKDYRQYFSAMAEKMTTITIRYPSSFGIWARILQILTFGVNEIVMLGPGNRDKVREVMSHYIPLKVFQSAPTELEEFPLLKGKGSPSEIIYFLCKENSCQNPGKDFSKLLNFL
jgi:uncharacterized protein YyaL (SSP411 family)